ncbi:MAG: hypothetical protein KFF73_06860 [Cyclobacteriaceae bacterium]|nr:hypothetical protein [Cyclobacteriaceae bacterium]
MKKILSDLALTFLIAVVSFMNTSLAADGNTTIAKWKDNKKGAYTLRFDDSMWSHHDHTVPNLIKRGLVGSFFINPATERYGYGIGTWESLASRAGIELCPHTMNHTGAADYEEADYEIGEAFRTVWELNPRDKSKLYPFSRGGGTTWPSGYENAVQNKYPAGDYQHDAVRYAGNDNREELIAFAKKAIKDNAWHIVLTHGTGPDLEWLGFEVSNFEALLDYLASAKEELWIGTAGDIYKYVTERKTARVNLIENKNDLMRLGLTSEADVQLYDYPLTLITEVPAAWVHCHVTQGKFQGIYPVKSGKVMYEAVPNRGNIILRSSSMDTTPPVNAVVRDGTGEDLDLSFSTAEISANWDPAMDEESGISKYWYRIGTTPGGSEVLDWIDNGLESSFTTSRTHFSLVRGQKYYITIKAVNGVGLSSESTSDGFTINLTPGNIAFKEDFDNGYLSQWDEKRTRMGSLRNILFISDQAAYHGGNGLQCHLEPGVNSTPYIAKHELTGFKDLFTRFHFRLGPDFTMPEDGGALQLMELRDNDGEFVAGVYIGNTKGAGLHVYAMCLDNTGYRTSLPGIRSDYPLSYIPVERDKWQQIDLRTVEHDGKGGAEFWLNGVRKGCITDRFTLGMTIRSLMVGAIKIPEGGISGEIFFDEIRVSDSMLGN